MPLHTVFLHSPLVTGPVKLALRKRLPIETVDLILGNDLAGEKLFLMPQVRRTRAPSLLPSRVTHL